MSYTIAQVIANAQRTLPDLQAARALDLANQVHREILAAIPELARNPYTAITPVSGQAEYALGETAFQVDLVIYSNSSVLTPVSGTTVEDLDKNKDTWRQSPSMSAYPPTDGSQPQFYLSSAIISAATTRVIGFYPTPGFTAGSFLCYGSQLQAADLTTASTCLSSLFSSQVYVSGLIYYGSQELRPEITGAFKAVYAEQLALNMAFVRTANGDVRGATKLTRNPRDGGYPVAK